MAATISSNNRANRQNATNVQEGSSKRVKLKGKQGQESEVSALDAKKSGKKDSEINASNNNKATPKIDADSLLDALSELLPNVSSDLLENFVMDVDLSAASSSEELAEMLEGEVMDLLVPNTSPKDKKAKVDALAKKVFEKKTKNTLHKNAEQEYKKLQPAQ